MFSTSLFSYNVPMPPNSFGRPENKWAEHGTFYIYQPNARQKIVFSAGLEGFFVGFERICSESTTKKGLWRCMEFSPLHIKLKS